MNPETILSYLNTPIQELFKDEDAIAQAKDILKKYECFNGLLKGKEDLFNEVEKICLLELFTNLNNCKFANRDFLLGYKYGIKTIFNHYQDYLTAQDVLRKEGH